MAKFGKPRSIRVRTASIIALAFCVFLTLFFAASFFSIRNSLLARSDAEVRTELGLLLRSVTDATSFVELARVAALHVATGEARLHLTILRAKTSGFTLLYDDSLTERPPDSIQRAALAHLLQPIKWESQDGNSRLRSIAAKHGDMFAIASMNMIVIEEAQDAMVRQYGLMLLLGVLVSFFVGYTVANLSLAPITELIRGAEAIRERGANRNARLPITARVHEVALLARTINEVLDERNASIEQLRNFTADAAHELRTPLTVLKGEIEVELRISAATGERNALLESNLEEVDRLIAIVQDLLLLATIDSQTERSPEATDETFDLDSIAGAVITRLSGLVTEKGISLEANLDSSLQASGDAQKFARLLYNVVLNAIQYTPAGGSVQVKAETAQNRAMLSIRDTGVGIAPDDLPHVFERFYRGDPSRSRKSGGAGLGLAIAKSIAEEAGYQLRIESELGRGTTVTVEFLV
ncbi:MAG: ATP-binding protein [Candidatus Kapaibacterium sp.]